jgi:hypothetical protein
VRAPHSTIAGAAHGLWKCGQRQRVAHIPTAQQQQQSIKLNIFEKPVSGRSMLGTEVAAQSSPAPPSAANRRHVLHGF